MKTRIMHSALAALLLAPLSAMAQGVYGFGEIAYSTGDVDTVSLSDDSGVGYAFGGGYMFNDMVGAEGGFVSYGELDADTKTLDGNGWFAGARLQVPLSDGFAAFGRLGMHWWDIDLTGELAEEGNDTYFGIGGQFDFTEGASAYAGWNRYLIDYPGSDVTYDHWGVGLLFSF